jgi:hypothetical protein
MKNLLAPFYRDVLAFRWMALSGLYVLLCRLKRDANMSLLKLGNSKDSLFVCRALSIGRWSMNESAIVELILGCAVKQVNEGEKWQSSRGRIRVRENRQY